MKKPKKNPNPQNPKASGNESGSGPKSDGKQRGKTTKKGKAPAARKTPKVTPKKHPEKKTKAASPKGVPSSKRAKPMTDGLGKKFDFGNQLDRMVAVYQKLRAASLRGQVVPMAHLRELVGNHDRTIHRIKARLAKEPYLVSIEYDYAERGYRMVNPKAEDYLKIGPGLNHQHLVALEVARQALGVFEGVHFADQLRDSFEKISGAHTTPKALGLGVPISTLVSFRTPGAGVTDPGVFQTITQALLEHRVLESYYTSRSKPVGTKRLMLEPLHLACVADRWILVARDRARNPDDHPIRTYILKRFTKVILSRGDNFAYPEDFRPEHYVQSAFGVHSGPSDATPIMVKLRISERGAHHVLERKWHPTQKVKNLPAGAIEVDFRVSHTGDIKRWILAFGSDCEVLEPASLRKEVAEEAALMLELYPSEPTGPA